MNVKKLFISAVLAAAVFTSVCFAACGGTEEEGDTYDPSKDPDAAPYIELSQYYGECEQAGTVEELSYHVESYAVEKAEDLAEGSLYEDKMAYVYLPYGYTAEKQYNVLYLLHGSNETQDYWFYTQKTVTPYYRKVMGITNPMYTMNYTKNVVDNLIAQGKCQPFIIVMPTYHSTLRAEKAYGDTQEDTEIWLTTFERELREDIIPAVEQKYSTYAGGDTSDEALTASRDHRAIAGFSKGSRFITQYCLNGMLDVFSSFGCFHGCQNTTSESISAEMKANPGCNYNFLYLGSGASDSRCDPLRELNKEITADLSGVFTQENYIFYEKPQGGHYYDSALLDLYNFIQIVYAAA